MISAQNKPETSHCNRKVRIPTVTSFYEIRKFQSTVGRRLLNFDGPTSRFSLLSGIFQASNVHPASKGRQIKQPRCCFYDSFYNGFLLIISDFSIGIRCWNNATFELEILHSRSPVFSASVFV
jgi:hypothetical protein